MKAVLALLGGGILFGIGLAASDMVEQEVVLGFLQLRDMGLAVTMAAALLVAAPVYQLAPRAWSKPPAGQRFDKRPRTITTQAVLGSVIFGAGWGLSGICPGSAIASLGVGNWPVLLAVGGMFIGAYLEAAVIPRSGSNQPKQAAGVPGGGRGHEDRVHAGN